MHYLCGGIAFIYYCSIILNDNSVNVYFTCIQSYMCVHFIRKNTHARARAHTHTHTHTHKREHVLWLGEFKKSKESPLWNTSNFSHTDPASIPAVRTEPGLQPVGCVASLQSLHQRYICYLCKNVYIVLGGGAVLQTGKSRDRFPMVSSEFFINIFLPAALWPWGRLSL
jgi:hypothetical protein